MTFNYKPRGLILCAVIIQKSAFIYPSLLFTYWEHFFHQDYLVLPKSILYFNQLNEFLNHKMLEHA